MAFDLLQRAAAALPDSELAWFNLGHAADRLQRYEVAARAFERAARINPKRMESTINRVAALVNLERCEEAIALARAILEQSPEQKSLYYYLYRCYSILKDTEAAKGALERYEAK